MAETAFLGADGTVVASSDDAAAVVDFGSLVVKTVVGDVGVVVC